MSKLLTIPVTATFALALFGAAGCKGGEGAKSAKLIPEGATIVVGADLASLQKTKLWTDVGKGMVEKEGKDVLEAMEGCNLGLDKWKSVTVGMTDSGDNEKVAVILVADGLGKKENLDCAHGKIKEKEGEEPWTAEDDGKTLKMNEDGAVAYVVDDNTIVMAGKAWADSVGKLTKGEGKSAMDGSLKDVLGRTDLSKNIWFAGQIPEAMGGMASAQLGAAPKDVAGYLDLSSGMEIFASAGMASAEDAGKVKEKVEGMYNGMVKDMAKQQGVSADTLDGVEFGTDGSAFTVKAKASDEDVNKAVDQAKALL